MECINATSLRRKSRTIGHPTFVAGEETADPSASRAMTKYAMRYLRENSMSSRRDGFGSPGRQSWVSNCQLSSPVGTAENAAEDAILGASPPGMEHS